jgi:hypothetical protein
MQKRKRRKFTPEYKAETVRLLAVARLMAEMGITAGIPRRFRKTTKSGKYQMMYRTFRQLGYSIGSGAVENAVGHVVQQRMIWPGMRRKADGADAMLALRSAYGSHGAWGSFWAYRAA